MDDKILMLFLVASLAFNVMQSFVFEKQLEINYILPKSKYVEIDTGITCEYAGSVMPCRAFTSLYE